MNLRFFIFSTLILSCLTLSLGCAMVHQRTAEFKEEEYEPYSSEGTAQICGQAFLYDRDGRVRYSRRSKMILKPITSYTKEWFAVQILVQWPMSPADPREESYKRTTPMERYGRFCFTDLPAGEYFLASKITWRYRPPYYSSRRLKDGGWAYAMVKVEKNESKEVWVTR